MNWKSLLYTVVGVLLALVVWEMFVKKLVPASGYEGETYDSFDYGYMKKVA